MNKIFNLQFCCFILTKEKGIKMKRIFLLVITIIFLGINWVREYYYPPLKHEKPSAKKGSPLYEK